MIKIKNLIEMYEIKIIYQQEQKPEYQKVKENLKKEKYSLDLYKLIEREENRFIVQDSEGDKLRRKLSLQKFK